MTKIDIFSGFLGAGKTTLIKKLIKEAYTGEQIVLIENEFGEIGIDGGFLQDAGIKITEFRLYLLFVGRGFLRSAQKSRSGISSRQDCDRTFRSRKTQ